VKGSPPVPVDEPERLAALLSCHILDTPPEPAFDGIALLASQLCGAPTALVSLVDESRQWFKARVGFHLGETPRSISFCAHAILGHAPFVIEDTRADPRFADNPLVTGEPFVRFYAGVPLVLEDGSAIGSLCVLDQVPRHLTESQLASLKVLARQVATEIGLRRKLASSAPPPRPSSIPAAPDGPTLELTTARRELPSAALLRLPVGVGELVEERYRVDALLGEGGMGVVARALDTRSGANVAIKFMLAQALGHQDALQRFVREAQILLKIDSPHVARVLDVGNLPGGEPFIVMEYLEGEDLKERLERERRMAPAGVVEVALQLCSALDAAHQLGILHRDLKPANLFLCRERDCELLKVLDFGISKLIGTDDGSLSPLTSDATIVGSPHYMSPEQMVTPSRIDARSDLWSMGVVLYELLLGRSPFDGHTLAEVCAQVLTHDPPPLHEQVGDVPAELSGVVWRCLRKHPEARFQSAAELRRELEKLRS
jgi:predicted Ser/Thr protein kinase